MGDSKCPPPPTVEEKFSNIKDALNSLGGDQKCKNIFNSSDKNSLEKVDAAFAVASLGGVGGGTASVTASSNELTEKLSKEGCADIFANITQQIQSTQTILCELNKDKNVTSISGSANSTIVIRQRKPTINQVEAMKEALRGVPKPIPPILPQYVPGESLETYKLALEGYKLATNSYNEALKIVKEETDNIMGKVTINRTSIKNRADVDLQVLSDSKNISTTNLINEFRKVAKAQAFSDIKQKSGYGGNNETIKSLVATKLNDKNQEITTIIKNKLQKIEIGGMSGASFSLLFYGSLELNGVIIDQYAQTRIITKSIMKSASNMGKLIALDILQDSTTTAKSEQTATGQEEVLKEIFNGQLALSKANAEGASKLFSQVTSFMSFGLIGMVLIGLVLLFFVPNILPGKSSGVIGIVFSAVLVYLIAAWFMNWFPFSKSNLEEPPRYRFDDIPRNTIREEYVTPPYVPIQKKKKSLY